METVRIGTVRGVTPMKNETCVSRVQGGARFGPKAGVKGQGTVTTGSE